MIIQNKKPIIAQENHYYPFGMNLAGIEKKGTSDHKFQFQGKETQEEFRLNWSSFKWRNANVQLGRFHSVDPLAEDYYYNSPYTFSENKVVAHIELEGLESMNFMDALSGSSENWINTEVFVGGTDGMEVTIEKSKDFKAVTITYSNETKVTNSGVENKSTIGIGREVNVAGQSLGLGANGSHSSNGDIGVSGEASISSQIGNFIYSIGFKLGIIRHDD